MTPVPIFGTSKYTARLAFSVKITLTNSPSRKIGMSPGLFLSIWNSKPSCFLIDVRINARQIIGKPQLKSNACQGTIRAMVISLLGSSGVKCQVADFSLTIDPPAKKKGNLTLLTTLAITEGNIIPEEDVVNGPGEYEIEGVKVRGVALPKEGG